MYYSKEKKTARRRNLILRLAIAGVALSLATSVAAIPPSKGVYRLPYQNGTDVKVSRDHESHEPFGRIDMGGKGGSSPYKIVAAADGWVRYVVDQNDGPSDAPCKNNYVWIEHATGEWTKYSHMRKNSSTATAKLVKGGVFFNAVFRPAGGVPWVARHNLTSAQIPERVHQAQIPGLPAVASR